MFKIHTDNLSEADIRAALSEAQDLGYIQAHVRFDTMDERGSRSHKTSFHVHLGTNTRDRDDSGKMRRKPTNSANSDDLDEYTATYRAWGFFLAEVFYRDADAFCGPYKGQFAFQEMTRYAF